jgi:acylaminoacyl-peptidase
MTTWAIGHTDRFQSAISQRPVTEWLSMAGASDIGYNFVFDEMGATPYSDAGRAELTFRSPLTYVANVKTPLLMMHGEYDMRTPIAQTEMYYVAMKTLTDTPVEMVRFPQAWHGVSRNGLPNLRNARLDVMFDWLQRTFAD